MNRYYNIHAHRPDFDKSRICAIVNLSIDDLFLQPEGIEPYLPYSLGIHPWHIESDIPLSDRLEILSLRLKESNIVALGECGLDAAIRTPMTLQIALFKEMIRLSEYHQKPIILHAVRSFHLLLQLRKEFRCVQPWILHGFRGNASLARQLRNAGIAVSIGSRFHPDLFLGFDWQQILIESDTAPAEEVIETVRMLADRLWVPESEIIATTKKNAIELIPALESF